MNVSLGFADEEFAMSLVTEFRDFIIKGNAVDLAVGIIIGAAFGGVVNSLVQDIVMPPIGAAMGGIDFSSMGVTLVDEIKAGSNHPVTQIKVDKDIPSVVLRYGKFINAAIALLIQGFAVFMIVKVINSMKKKQDDAPPPAPPEDTVLLREIRDALSKSAPRRAD
jgi:large conductance mechanosensitive channel